MLTIDECVMKAPVAACFRAGADVERWPEWLPHYRWVCFLRKDAFGTGLVEMAAYRGFGPLPWPVWWVSEMRLDAARPAVLYRHVRGVTTGMEVAWTFTSLDARSTRVRIEHRWAEGPRWPLPRRLRRAIARVVVGPAFVSAVASRTLAGIRRHVEHEARGALPAG